MTGSKNTRFVAILIIGALLGLAAGALTYQVLPGKQAQRPNIPGLLWPESKPLEAFSLEDQHGNAFDLARLKGKWSFLFFGYTHCPDVCPVTLEVLKNAARLMRQGSSTPQDIQIAFVSVDPERDTKQHLREYLAYFDTTFLGVTGSKDKLDALTKQLGILYFTGKADAEGNYLVDHTASVLLIDPRGHLVAVFGAPHEAEEMAARFEKIRAYFAG
jgi:protein SCO1